MSSTEKMVDNQGTPDDPSEEEENGNNRGDTMTRREGEESVRGEGGVTFRSDLSPNPNPVDARMPLSSLLEQHI